MAFARVLKANPEIDRVDLYAVLTQFAQASASLAAEDYAARRAEAGIRGSITVPHAPPPTPEHFSKTLNWVYGARSTVAVLPDTMTVTPSKAEVLSGEAQAQAERDRLETAMTRLAVQSGRETTVQAVQQDRQARAWARETRGDCCYFCALMAARGAVYKSAGAAGKDANEKFAGAGEFKFHNNCHCVAVPVFGVYEKPADARSWNRQYHDLRRDLGRAPSLLEWRNAFGGVPTNDLQPAGI